MIADDAIAEIRRRSDLVALIGQHVKLLRHGHSYRGLCPFHAEKTPSFYVHPARHFFHCFGCHASGDALAFLMRIEGLSFPEAAQRLAERCGVTLPETAQRRDPQVERQRQQRDRSHALLECAAAFFVQQLQRHADASLARDELAHRRIEAQTAAAFRLGFAPPGWDQLGEHLRRQGFAEREAEALGLLVAKAGGRSYDRFRQRLMFPIMDTAGRVVGFSGRHLAGRTDRAPADAPPKYMNSPESALFHKGDLLYGLHQARVAIRQQGQALICEGNFDVVALHQAGFQNAVAPLGTAFTEGQAELLRRTCDRLVLLFDADAAGQKAMHRVQPVLQKAGFTSRVVALPRGDDPESYLRKHSAASLQQRLNDAPSLLTAIIDDMAQACDDHPGARAQAVAALRPMLAGVDNPLEQRLYAEHVARRFAMQDLATVHGSLFGNAAAPRTPAAPKRRTADAAALALQAKLVGVLLDQPKLAASDEAQQLPSLLTDPLLRAILPHIVAWASSEATADASELLRRLDGVDPNDPDQARAAMQETHANSPTAPRWPALRRWLEGRLARPEHEQPNAARDALRAGVTQLARRHLHLRCQSLKGEILEAIRQGDSVRAQHLSQQRHELERLSGHAAPWQSAAWQSAAWKE